ncbi:MAG: HD domain-containing protein [Flavobacteriales bacterium]|nr:HD domain-containing protein [Flavobacteriales bacterium]NQX97574.1 HD domain-containing protein [Flavobacteriales bacterium]
MSEENQILKKVDDYVFKLFKTANTDQLLYHNYKHTYDVVEACKEIGEGLDLGSDELEILLIAAWFHDVGYLESYEDHEELGISKATEFLLKEKYPEEKIATISTCIMVTKMEVQPTSLLQEIICDADMKGLSSSNYSDRSKLLREECLLFNGDCMVGPEWLEREIAFLSSHNYYTKYALLNYNENKLKNILKRKTDLTKKSNKSSEQDKKNQIKEQELNFKIQKSEIPEKGIETMFRTALKNHMELSAIADNKANIMLSINALILSIVISSLFSKFDKHPELMIPSVFMLIVCLATIVMATLSTKPKVTAGKFSTDDVKNRKANLLFFGNFHNMDLNDYEWGMKEIMKDKEYLYSSLIRDLHSLGVVLAKKYTYLRLCYTIFMYGMIVSVIMFGVSMLISKL